MERLQTGMESKGLQWTKRVKNTRLLHLKCHQVALNIQKSIQGLKSDSNHDSAHTVWRPDIVLYNNDDGNYDPTVKTNVIIKSNGVCEWMPPAIYKESFDKNVQLISIDESKIID